MILLMIFMCFVSNLYIVQCIDPPTILLNHMVLPISLKETNKYSASYNYVNGDMVDMACISENCENISVDYANFDGVVDSFSKSSPSLVQSSHGVGFRMELQEKHNNSQILCTCSREHENSTVEVIFNSRKIEEFDFIDQIQINGLTGRIYKYETKRIKIYKPTYQLPAGKNFTLILEKNKEHINDFILGLNELVNIPRIEESKLLNDSCSFTIKRSSQKIVIKTKIEVSISTLPAVFIDDGPKIDLSKYKMLLQLYNFANEKREKWFLSNYLGDEILDTCKAVTSDFGDQDPSIRSYNRFDHTINDKAYICDWEFQNKKIHILYLKQKRIIVEAESLWKTVAVALTICVFLVILAVVSIAYYKKKQHQQAQRQPDNLYPSFQPQTRTPPRTIPGKIEVPDYQEPDVIQREADYLYAEPYTAAIPTYAQAIPKSQRNHTIPVCVPNIKLQDPVQSGYGTDSENVYGNINGKTTDHVEPTYSQPHIN